jgi:hypothetical protein
MRGAPAERGLTLNAKEPHPLAPSPRERGEQALPQPLPQGGELKRRKYIESI